MKSGYKITWSLEASYNLSAILSYLEYNWTQREIRKFSLELDKTLDLIAKRPRIFAATNKKKDIRRCVLSRQTSIYYKVSKGEVLIVSLFDNRRNPDEIPVE